MQAGSNKIVFKSRQTILQKPCWLNDKFHLDLSASCTVEFFLKDNDSCQKVNKIDIKGS